jgi:hypothetical protein
VVGDKTLFAQANMSFTPFKKKIILLDLKKKKAISYGLLGLHVFFLKKS